MKFVELFSVIGSQYLCLFQSKRQSQIGDYKSAKCSSIAVASLLVAAVVFEVISSITITACLLFFAKVTHH